MLFSPWSMYLAWLSRATGIRDVVIAHTVYPPILLGMSYSAYYEIGSQLFRGKRKVHERAIFLLMVSMINLFMAGNAYTQSVFTLTRFCQGKAVVASMMIPSILAVILRIQAPDNAIRRKQSQNEQGYTTSNVARLAENKTRIPISYNDWLLLFVIGAGCCLFSGMGIAIGLIMLFVYCAYVVVKSTIVSPRNGWKQIPLWLLSLAPSIVFGICYFRLKG